MKIKACKWNAETVIDCAIKYKSWKDFSENGPSAAYAAARYLNLIPEIVSQMEHPFYGNQIYSDEDLINKAKMCATKKEFRISNASAYQACRKRGILDIAYANIGVLSNLKICIKCLTNKPLSDFYKQSNMTDRYFNKCKNCTRMDNKKYRDMNKGSKPE